VLVKLLTAKHLRLATLRPEALLSAVVRIVVDYRPALRGRTGVGHYLFHLVEALLARDALLRAGGPDAPVDELTLFTSSWKDRPLPDDLRRLGRARVVDRRLPVQLLNLLWHRAEWPPVETVTGERFDLAYSPHPLLLPSRHAAQVLTIYDLDFLRNPERAVREIRRDYPKLVRGHAHRADHVIVCSHYTARQVEAELGLGVERTTVCYPGGPDWPAPPAGHPRTHVLFVGTLERRKNVATLLDAYAALVSRRPDTIPLVLAGTPRDEAAPWLARLAQPPLAGKARYEGYVSDERRRQLFESAALFVLPSYEEGFGMPVLEAMTAGVPVIVSNRGALPEVADTAGTIVDPDNAEELSAAMERLLADEGLRASRAALGVQRAKQFRWAATANAARSAFERAVGTHAERKRARS
jgi:glycosyltransferase involved in cell wall biosynthesis